MFESNTPKQTAGNRISRRAMLAGAGVGAAALIFWPYRGGGRVLASTQKSKTGPVKIAQFSDDGKKTGEVEVQRVVKSDADWQAQLGPGTYDITRRADTEIAYTGKTWNNHDAGMYRCVCCDTALYSSKTKYDSGEGWPSFWAPIAKENISQITDDSFGMARTAIACARCDAHLGHVFNDGPEPTGLRYCMNSASMTFKAAPQV